MADRRRTDWIAYAPKDGDDGTYVLNDRKADREDKATACFDGEHPLSVDL